MFKRRVGAEGNFFKKNTGFSFIEERSNLVKLICDVDLNCIEIKFSNRENS